MTYQPGPDDPYRPAQPRFTPAAPELPPTSLRRQSAQQPGYTQQYPPPPPPGYYGQQPQGWQQPPAAPPRKKRRVFMWFFFAVQVIFIIWLVIGLSSAHVTPSHAEVLKGCANGAWRGLFTSYSDCMTHYANGLKQSGEAGTAIGAGLIVVVWMVVDFFLAVGYGIYRLATRR